jgi:hypothetical protein
MTSNVRTCYQLWADGDSLNGWRFKMKSKAIYARREDAERGIPEFRDKCIDTQYFESAEPETLKIEVVELEFYD